MAKLRELATTEVAAAQWIQPDDQYLINGLADPPVQVLSLLKAAGGEQEGASWEQGELAETLWAEMGLQPDAHITQVSTI